MHVHEVTPGEFTVEVDGSTLRVVVPAGVGLPGVEDDELVTHVVAILRARGAQLPEVVDVSLLLGSDPGLAAEVERRSEDA